MTSSPAFPPGLFGLASSAPAPLPTPTPATVPAVPTCTDVRGLTAQQVSAEMARLHAELVTNGVFAASELALHEDGSAAIKSQIAVWLLGAVAAGIGKKKIVNLSKIDKTLLRSTAGVGKLVCRALGIATTSGVA